MGRRNGVTDTTIRRMQYADPRAAQGWDRADFHCGRCGHAFTATTEAQYLREIYVHGLTHDLLDASTPELRAKIIDAALAEVKA